MARSNITATSAVQVSGGPVREALITINTGFTGTILVEDHDGTAGSTIATITNPTVGMRFKYWSLKKGLRVTSSATGDITVSTR